MRTTTRRRATGRAARHHRPSSACRNSHADAARLQRLLDQRDRLADQAHESDAHGYRDAVDAWQILGATEDAIRQLDPRGYRRRAETWAEQDLTTRVHTPDDPRPESCTTCRNHHGHAPDPAA